MKTAVSKLIQVLEQESELTKELVETLQQDQRRIIEQDIAGIEKSNLTKEGLVLRFQALEESRLELTRRLGDHLQLQPDDMRISKICPALGPEGRGLEQAAEKLRALVGSLDELVAVGRGFLEQSILGISWNLGPRANSRLSGSSCFNSRVMRLDCRYVAEVTISLCTCLTSQPLCLNSVASQSKSCGWLGHSPRVPKSSDVRTIPDPK